MQSFGYKGKNAAASFVTDLRRKKVPANVYNPGDVKTRGDTPITDVKQFQTTLNVYSQITGSPLGEGSEPTTLPPLTFRPVEAFGTGGQGRAVAYGGGVWVAVGQNALLGGTENNIYISSDHGNTWTAKTAFGAGGIGYAVAYDGSGRWIAVGTGGIWTSINNGTSWQVSFQFIQGNSVAYGNGVWVVVGQSVTGGDDNIYISPDGESWTEKSAFGMGGYGQAVAYGGGVWVAVGQNGDNNSDKNIYISTTNGDSWEHKIAFGTQNLGGQGGNAVAYGNSIWVAVGEGRLAGGSTNNIYISSDHGISWIPKSAFAGEQGNAVAYGGGVWVAGGVSTDFQNVYSSTDNGDTWIPSTDIPVPVFSVAYGNGQWVAVGLAAPTSIFTSQNGRDWTGQFAFGFEGGGIAVAYGADGVWVAVGLDGVNDTAGPNNIFVGTT
jgi:hypothetical protein